MTAPIFHTSDAYLWPGMSGLRVVCYTDGGDTTRVEYTLRWDGRELHVEPADEAAFDRLAPVPRPKGKK